MSDSSREVEKGVKLVEVTIETMALNELIEKNSILQDGSQE